MYYSQFGEDRILSALFGDKTDGACVEVGANDGLHGSTSLFFERMGWTCVLVEPNPTLAAILRRDRSAEIFECAASSADGTATLHLAEGEGLAHAVSTLETGAEARETLRRHNAVTRPVEVATRRLDAILEESGLRAIDFISIDVEGHELEALKGLSLERWRPAVLLIEDNSRLKDRRVPDHLAAAGYVRFRRTGVNDWYAHEGDRRFVRGPRRLRYAASAAKAGGHMGWIAAKTQLARIPGVLPLARRVKRLWR